MALALALVGVLAGACSGPPWYMGAPLNGRPSIPPTTASRSWRQQRVVAARANEAGEAALELRALLALETVQRLEPGQPPRLEVLLARRAGEFHALGRAVPESRDLEHLARLSPSRGAALRGERATAARAAGDTWLALGETAKARAAYELAISLGADDVDLRVLALWEHPPPATTPLAELRTAIATLPLRAVPPLVSVYLARGGTDVATLERGLVAARQDAQGGLSQRLEVALQTLREASGDGGVADRGEGADAGAREAAPVVVAPAASPPDAGPPVYMPIRSDLPRWMVSGASVSARLVPLARAYPESLDDLPLALHWVDLALDEDSMSPDLLEVAALTFGRARRFGGTERMLAELVYATPDRAAGFERAARTWERLDRPRDACVNWLRAARWRDDPEDPTWRTGITCARRLPGIADPAEIRAYVLARAVPTRRAALSLTLDAP
jgi:hypothetical protein